MNVENHHVASGKHSKAAVSRRLVRADGVYVVLEHTKRSDTPHFTHSASLDRSAAAGRCTHLAEGERQVCVRRVAAGRVLDLHDHNHTEEVLSGTLSGVH